MNTVYITMKSTDMRVSLPATLEAAGAEYGLFEITGKLVPCPRSGVYLCADFVDSSLVEGTVLPVLRRIKFSQQKDQSGAVRKTYNPVLYVPVIRNRLDDFRLYITDAEGDLVPFEICSLNCTLVATLSRNI